MNIGGLIFSSAGFAQSASAMTGPPPPLPPLPHKKYQRIQLYKKTLPVFLFFNLAKDSNTQENLKKNSLVFKVELDTQAVISNGFEV